MGNAFKALSDDASNCIIPLEALAVVFSRFPRGELPKHFAALQTLELLDTVGQNGAWIANTLSHMRLAAPKLIALRIDIECQTSMDTVLNSLAELGQDPNFYQVSLAEIVNQLVRHIP